MVLPIPSINEISSANQALRTTLDSIDPSYALNHAGDLANGFEQVADEGAPEGAQAQFNNLMQSRTLAEEPALTTPVVNEAAEGSPSDEITQEELGAMDVKGTTNMGAEPSTGQTPPEETSARSSQSSAGEATAEDDGLPDILQLLLQSLFSAIDKDGDGEISMEELTALLKSADKNNDGKLEASELLEAITGKEGAQAGSNELGNLSDGISIAELTDALMAADANGDGLDMQELTDALMNLMTPPKSTSGGENAGEEAASPVEQETQESAAQEASSKDTPEANDGSAESSAGSMSSLLNILLKALFNSIDKDGDGKITLEEIDSFLQASDANGDGKLGSGELLNALAGGENEGDIAGDQGIDLGDFSRLLMSADPNGDGLHEQELIDAMVNVLSPDRTNVEQQS